MKKFAFYTAVFGKKSKWRRPEYVAPDIDKFFYTDLEITNDFYQMKRIKLDHLDSVRRNRFVKICIPDEIFDNYEYSFYVDYKHPATVDFDHFYSHLDSDSDFLISKHKKRNCIYDEGRTCIEKGKGDEPEILRQMAVYEDEGYPTHNGLFANYWIFRRHTKRLKEFMRLWWLEVDRRSERDQISLPYMALKHGMKISLYKRPE